MLLFEGADSRPAVAGLDFVIRALGAVRQLVGELGQDRCRRGRDPVLVHGDSENHQIRFSSPRIFSPSQSTWEGVFVRQRSTSQLSDAFW